MTTKRFGRVFLVAVAVGSLPLGAFADEVVHFTNGAEMTVRSHTVENSKDMVRLDLGGNSFIAFPMSMVDKIVNSGQDVFLNPVFHPANQAIAGGAGTVVADTSNRGTGDAAPYVRRPGAKLGETSNAQPIPAGFGQVEQQAVAASRKVFNPAFPPTPGSPPQVIMPPGMKDHTPVQFQMIPTRPAQPVTTPPPPPAPPPPADTETPDNTPPPSDPPQDPPDTP